MVNEEQKARLKKLITCTLCIDGKLTIPEVGTIEIIHNKHSTQKTMDGNLLMIPPSKSVTFIEGGSN